MTTLEEPPSAPILANPQARPRAERLATVRAEILNVTYLLINLKDIQSNLIMKRNYISPNKWFLSCVNHHVITECVLLIKHLATDLTGVSLAVQNLVLVGHVAVLCGIPPSPTTEGTQPLFVSVCLATDFCNKSEAK